MSDDGRGGGPRRGGGKGPQGGRPRGGGGQSGRAKTGRRGGPPVRPADDRAGAARRAAHEVALRVLRDGAFADRALHGVAADLDPRDRAQAKRLAFGVVQRRLTLDHLIERHVTRTLDPEVRVALHIGLYELIFSDGVPDRAAVSSAVELAKPNAGFALVNAVLRAVATERDRPEGLGLPADDTPEGAAIRHSHPEWLVQRWWKWLGPNVTRALLAAGNRPSELVLRVNTIKSGTTGPWPDVPGDPFDPELPEAHRVDGPLDVVAHPGWGEGRFVAMSRGSMLAARAVDPQPGERVLDLCAAPGGKTTYLAALMQNRGEIVAVEAHKARARALGRTCDRNGASIVDVVHGDALEVDLPVGSFDRVLLDAPCSGLGTLASHPDLRWRVQDTDLAELARLQGRLLAVAERALKPGGRLVYSVCTLNPGEERLGDGTVRRLMPHRDRTDGFYIATREG
ncbi:MAG: transcription antitermination factor NusB [Solirubrobacteraceae bacterium]